MDPSERQPPGPLRRRDREAERNTAGDGRQIAEGQAGERNRLLRAIPPDEYRWLLPHLKSVRLESGQVLAEPNEPFRFIYFPETAVVSQVNRMADGALVEVGTIGKEGIVGLSLFLDAETVPSQVMAQVPGDARRMPAAVFDDGARARLEFQRVLRRYTQAYLVQVAQTAACNRMHSLEERCARWLLMTHDRVGEAQQFTLTHEFLATMLGVRRAGVTVAAGALQKAGLIRYSRGRVTILDRAGLEAACCECYGIVREYFGRLFPGSG